LTIYVKRKYSSKNHETRRVSTHAQKHAEASADIPPVNPLNFRKGGLGAGSTKGESMRSRTSLVRSRAIAVLLASLPPLAGCAIPPSGIPTEASIRGLKPSGTVTMTQAFIAGTGVGSGRLAFRGRTYPFTLIGSLIGLGAISTMQASGEVYGLKDVSQFSGPWIQGTGRLAIAVRGNGEIWLENRNGVVMRLNAAQAGLTFGSGRYELYIQLSQ
jgi:hypothetical protein